MVVPCYSFHRSSYLNFFIDRPIFAAAIALMMVLAGLISMFVLPVAQYPALVPPQIQVTTQYIGGSADVVDGTVTTPLEEKLNGAQGMIYQPDFRGGVRPGYRSDGCPDPQQSGHIRTAA